MDVFLTILLLFLTTTVGKIEMLNLLEVALFSVIGCLLPALLALSLGKGFSLESLLILFFYSLEVLLRKYKRLELTEAIFNEMKLYEKKSKEQEGLVSQLLPKHAFLKLRNQNLSNKIELTDVIEGCHAPLC